VGTSETGGLKGRTISLQAAVHPGHAPGPDDEKEVLNKTYKISTQCLHWVFLRAVKWPRLATDHSSQSSAVVYKQWIYTRTSTPLQCLPVLQRVDFTLYCNREFVFYKVIYIWHGVPDNVRYLTGSYSMGLFKRRYGHCEPEFCSSSSGISFKL
jgi:hypothetical protein